MLKFDEEKHEYTFDGKKLISVTQLMQKHGLAPSYAGVSTDVLNAAAERGTLIHKEIEDWNKTEEIGFTPELSNYIQYIKENNIQVNESEYKVHNDIVAGTIDLILNYGKGYYTIADIKTTSVLHKDAVSWQLSIYAYLTGNPLITKGQGFHFTQDGELKVVDIQLKPVEEVERLMDCERKGVIYKQEISTKADNLLNQLAEAESIIKQIEESKKQAEVEAKALREMLIKEMESNAIKSFENDNIKLTYVAPSTKTTLDSKGIKEKYPDIYEEFSRTSDVKASLRITLKERKDDN